MKFKFPPIILWITLFAAPLPALYAFSYFFFSMQKIEQLEAEMQRIQNKTVYLEETRLKETTLLASLKASDPHYFDKHLENLHFLHAEIKKLEAIYAENPEDEQNARRLHSLRDGGNRLQFSEEQIRSHELFREVDEKQQRPIEINEEDLKKLLCFIEGIRIWPYGPQEGRPQLIIKDFSLIKKEMPNQEKVFVVSTQLLKRENVDASK